MTTPPIIHIDLAAFNADPYPKLARLRREAPVAYVPQFDAVLLTRRDDIFHWEKDIDVFSSEQPGGLMTRLMGHNMMRKDGPAHSAERKIFMRAVSPVAVKQVWIAAFQRHADRLLDGFSTSGCGDLVQTFARPLAGECLKEITGLTNITYANMDAWSQAMMDGIANYSGDAAIEARCHAATAGIDAAIDDRLRAVRATPDMSLLSVMIEGGMPLEHVRNNIKLAISGGQNEPRKAIAGCIWALLTHADADTAVRAGQLTYHQVFDEYVRWIAPIGMSPRRVTRDTTIHGVTIAAESRAFLMFNAANRDDAHFPEADRFMPGRDTRAAIAFGAGPHFCAGTWAAKAMIADVALPSIFKRLAGLRLDTREAVEISGWAFRGLRNLPAAWGD